MKMKLVELGLAVARWAGMDARAEVERMAGQVKELVGQVVALRGEAQGLKEQCQRQMVMLDSRRVEVVLTARIQKREAREAGLAALREAADLKALLDELDERWIAAVNDLTAPGMDDRHRQWAAGRAEAMMEIKTLLEARRK